MHGFKATNNLAVIGDKIDSRLSASPTAYQLQIANREILTYLDEDYMAICYYICINESLGHNSGDAEQISEVESAVS